MPSGESRQGFDGCGVDIVEGSTSRPFADRDSFQHEPARVREASSEALKAMWYRFDQQPLPYGIREQDVQAWVSSYPIICTNDHKHRFGYELRPIEAVSSEAVDLSSAKRDTGPTNQVGAGKERPVEKPRGCRLASHRLRGWCERPTRRCEERLACRTPLDISCSGDYRAGRKHSAST